MSLLVCFWLSHQHKYEMKKKGNISGVWSEVDHWGFLKEVWLDAGKIKDMYIA